MFEKTPYAFPFIFLLKKALFLEVDKACSLVNVYFFSGLKSEILAISPSAIVIGSRPKTALGFEVILSIKSSKSKTEFTAPINFLDQWFRPLLR